MDLYIIILRVIHIFGGVYWAGTLFWILAFPHPGVETTGPDKIVQRVLQYTRRGLTVGLAMLLTILSGILLYWRVSGRFNVNWITSGPGLALTIGGLAGIVAFLYGFVGETPLRKMEALAKEFQATGASPSPEQMAEFQALEEQYYKKSMPWYAVLVAISVLGMAVARYLWF